MKDVCRNYNIFSYEVKSINHSVAR